MSNRRRVKPSQREQDTHSDTVGTVKFLRSIAGIPLPNGCPDCAGRKQCVRRAASGVSRLSTTTRARYCMALLMNEERK